MNRKTWGVLLLSIGVAVLIAMSVNGNLKSYGGAINNSQIKQILLILGCFVSGIALLLKSK